MTDIDLDQLLSHQTIYFPWSSVQGCQDDPVKLTTALAGQVGLPITVMCSDKSSIPDALQHADYVTERSQCVNGRQSVILLYYPTRRLFDRTALRSAKYVVVAEWPDEPLETWAAKRRAWNARTRATMSLDISPEITETYGRILWNGNNGWHDAPGKRDALRDLEALRDRNLLIKEQLIGYLLGEKSSSALDQLEKLVDQVLTTRAP